MSKHNQTVEQEIRGLFQAHYRLAWPAWVGGENRIEVVIGDTPGVTSEVLKVWGQESPLARWESGGPNNRRPQLASISPCPWARRSGRPAYPQAGRVARDGQLEAYPAT